MSIWNCNIHKLPCIFFIDFTDSVFLGHAIGVSALPKFVVNWQVLRVVAYGLSIWLYDCIIWWSHWFCFAWRQSTNWIDKALKPYAFFPIGSFPGPWCDMPRDFAFSLVAYREKLRRVHFWNVAREDEAEGIKSHILQWEISFMVVTVSTKKQEVGSILRHKIIIVCIEILMSSRVY